MAIICLSKDDRLTGKLVKLHGPDAVIALSDVASLNDKELQMAEVAIVDLKYLDKTVISMLTMPVIALATVPSFQEALLLLQGGVKGYGNRQMRQENLGQAVDSVKVGQIWLPPAIITQLIETAGGGETALANSELLNHLTKREQEVALYVGEGMSNQKIADTMFVSLRTVKAHLSSIYEKTGLKNRLELGLKLKEKGNVC